MMIYLQKRVIDQNGRSPSSTENSKIRCGMTDKPARKVVKSARWLLLRNRAKLSEKQDVKLQELLAAN
ncbi:hypothetical protein, partial [Aeromonas caviae]|uniref:hypothetical protein n=1 Tax=Aeromonas caviae TaxID=648 RepID=UPI00283A9D54